MTKFSSENFTYGCELEFADVDITNKLPDECSWNKKDFSIVNSNGIANDPTGKNYKFGGEINTPPTKTISGQLQKVMETIYCLDPKPVINYKCNLHIHIGVPDLKNDVEALKKLFSYAYFMPEYVWNIIDPIEIPDRHNFPSEEAFKGAKKRYKRNLVSHRCRPSQKIYEKIMQAKIYREFIDSHAVRLNDKLYWAITARHGINFRQLEETGTIEFRHFFGTLSEKEYNSCFIWCKNFVESGLNEQKPYIELFKMHDFTFPKPERYNHELQTKYDLTNFHKNKREVAVENIKKLL